MQTLKNASKSSKTTFLNNEKLTYKSFTTAFASPLWPWYLCGLIFLALTNLISVQIPKFAGEVTDNFEKATPEDLASWATAIIVLGLLQIFCRSLSRIFIFWPGRSIEARSKVALFNHIINLAHDALDRFPTGELVSRLSNDLGQLRVFFAFAILQIFNLIFLTIFTISQMWQLSPKLTGVCLSPLILMFILTKVFIPKLQKYNKENQEAIGSLTNNITEAFSNIHLIKSSGAECSFISRCLPFIDNVYKANIKVIVLRTLLFPLISSLSSLAQVAILFYGGFLIIENQLKIGDIVAFNIYIGTLAFPLTSIGIIISIYQRGKVALERLSEITAVSPEDGVEKPSNPQISKPILEIKNLTFSYPCDMGRTEALKNINLKLFQGDKVGIVGSVSSGKSTLFDLICRIHSPPSNTIYYLGMDIKNIDPIILREKINYALQSPHLFSKSIRENLSFGLTNRTSIDKLKAATQMTALLQDIENLPEGWETQVGEKGIRLSGGQKQRLALSRLFLRNADIWLLDDVMSAVDSETESSICKSIFAQKKTILLVSHRPKALKLCDYVIYIKEGFIVDRGSYEQLTLRHNELGEFLNEEH